MVSQFKFLQSNDITNYVDVGNVRFQVGKQRHGFCVGVHRTQLLLHYEGDMDIESVTSIMIPSKAVWIGREERLLATQFTASINGSRSTTNFIPSSFPLKSR